jgi:hypothetical protein
LYATFAVAAFFAGSVSFILCCPHTDSP